MRLLMTTIVAAGVLGAGAAQAASVEVKDAVARVTVIPENRRDVKVEVFAPNARLPLQVRVQGDRTIIDGGLRMNRIRNCNGSGERRSVEVSGVGQVGWREIPQVVIHTPREVKLGAGGAVYGVIDRAASVDLANAGCGDWTVANVEGELHLHLAGSGDVRAGSAGSAKLKTAGSGDIAMAEIRGPLDADVAGSGDISVSSVAGPVDASIAGSGDVRIRGGHASQLSVSIAGSGDVDFGGVADNLKARIAGSGDVHAKQVRGQVQKSVIGSGGVTIG